jgi:hypothetical protein
MVRQCKPVNYLRKRWRKILWTLELHPFFAAFSVLREREIVHVASDLNTTKALGGFQRESVILLEHTTTTPESAQ